LPPECRRARRGGGLSENSRDDAKTFSCDEQLC
jgi:hypothetical protein